MSGNDPTDHALAVIASIFEKPDEKSADAARAVGEPESSSPAVATAPTVASPPADIDGYSKYGPGPLNALRFKWSVRRGADGLYYVDETIGGSSRPVSSGPLQPDEAIQFVDDRERECRRRFEALRSEISPTSSERGSSDDNIGGKV